MSGNVTDNATSGTAGWASNGWAISDGVTANTDLYEFFTDTVGKPERVYAWGDSLGGLVTLQAYVAPFSHMVVGGH